MKTINVTTLKKVLSELPLAFDDGYWKMADTTYKEEIAACILDNIKGTPEQKAKLLLKLGFKKRANPILFAYVNGDVESKMGMWVGITDKGKKMFELN